MRKIENYLKKHRLIFFLLIASVIASVLFLYRNTGLICDEVQHYRQVINFHNGDFRIVDIPATPGYHALITALLKLTGYSSLFAARCITAVFGFFTTLVYFFIVQRNSNGFTIVRTLQYFFFPAIFIFYFMVYTDILSLLLVMLMLLCTLNRRYALAGLFGILSMLVRQNNVIWVAFIPVLVYFESFGLRFSVNKIIETAKKTRVFLLGICLFILFVIFNKGVAIGDASSHPTFIFSTGNIFFILFCVFIFFLPMHIANTSKIIRYLISSIWPALITLLLFILYWFTFRFDHPYNSVGADYFIRNSILMRLKNSELRMGLFFIPIIISFWSLAVTPFPRKSWYIMYFFTVLFLLPSWLIEERYYIIPFVLFMLFRKDQSFKVEGITLIYYIIILCLLLPQITSLRLLL